MTASTFATVFLAALAVSLAVRFWLAARHVRHVRAHRDRVPPEFAARVSPEAHRKAADYTVAKTRFGRVEIVVETALLLALTFGGGLAALHGALSAWLASPLWRDVALVGAVSLISGAVAVPLSWHRVFGIEERFGFNRVTPRLFLVDLAKQVALSVAIGLPFLVLVLWLMARMGSQWWLMAWAAWVAFQLLMLVLYPTLIAPLFNRFTPLADGTVREGVERLLARCGFESRGVFVMDGSKRSAHGNAYFTGLGRAKRVVFFDTLLARLAPAEVEAVLAHELGHFRLRHVAKRMAWVFAASLGFLWLLDVLMRAPWFYAGLGAEVAAPLPQHGLALLLFSLALPVFTFLLHPVLSHYSRKHEYEADAYAARQASGRDLVQALVKLYEDNASTLTPDPVHSVFYDSHPPASLRVARLNAASPLAPAGRTGEAPAT